MPIKILSDSACDLPEEILKKYNIDILPIIVIKDDQEYLDRVTIKPETVYDNMRKGELYTTAQISASMFTDKFKEYVENQESVIYIAFSSGLSGTYQTSMIVRELISKDYPDFDLDIVDTKAASGGFGLIVLYAAKLAKEGKSKSEILRAIDCFVSSIEHIFTVDDIEYLFRGGRVSRTQALVGGLLNIKPILHVEEGKLVPLEKVRGKNKVYKKILNMIEKRSENVDLKTQTICITHGDDLEEALKLKSMIEEKFGASDFLINTIGASIGAHSGPGTLAVFFMNRDCN